MNEDKFNKTIEYNLNNSDYIDSAFKRIPTNAIINKAKCGIGGTTLELKDNRSSIIIVPNVSIIRSKQIEFPNLIPVYHQVTNQDVEFNIKAKLLVNDKVKILTTPESLKRVIDILTSIGMEVYSTFFLLFDEIHSVITEGTYRHEISKAFNDFFLFKHKALISATPLAFSDDRFYDFEYHKINIQEKPRKIDVISTNNVTKTVSSFLNSIDVCKENCHVFLNSVNKINDIVNLLKSDSVAIYCANNLKNQLSLGKNSANIKEPDLRPIAKYSFYTTKYFEGWDLLDDKCNLLFVSDVFIEHTCLDITSKVKQAFGRLRKVDAKRLIHITNQRGVEGKVNIKELEDVAKRGVNDAIETYNRALKDNSLILVQKLKNNAKEFSDFNKEGYLVPNLFKTDAYINVQKAIRQYDNMKTIEQSWKSINFVSNIYKLKTSFSEKESKALLDGRLGKNEKLKKIVNKLSLLFPEGNLLNFTYTYLEEESFIRDFPEEYKFFNTLGYKLIESLNFNYILVKREYQKYLEVIDIIKPIKVELSKVLYPNTFYSNEILVQKLELCYKKYGYNKKASPCQIKLFLKCEPMRKSINNEDKRGYLIIEELIY